MKHNGRMEQCKQSTVANANGLLHPSHQKQLHIVLLSATLRLHPSRIKLPLWFIKILNV